MVEQIAFPSFAKLHFAVPTPEDVAFCGQLQYYDKVGPLLHVVLLMLCHAWFRHQDPGLRLVPPVNDMPSGVPAWPRLHVQDCSKQEGGSRVTCSYRSAMPDLLEPFTVALGARDRCIPRCFRPG